METEIVLGETVDVLIDEELSDCKVTGGKTDASG